MIDAQLLWGINTALVAVVIFLVSIIGWLGKGRLARIESDLAKKADAETCTSTHIKVDKLLHAHALSGNAGEAVYK